MASENPRSYPVRHQQAFPAIIETMDAVLLAFPELRLLGCRLDEQALSGGVDAGAVPERRRHRFRGAGGGNG